MPQLLRISFLLAIAALPSVALAPFNISCQKGGQTVATSNIPSTTRVQQSFAGATVTVFIHGGAAGTVTTSGTAVTWVSGTQFNANSDWNGIAITINAVAYAISTVTDTTHLTLSSSAGTQTSVAYGIATAKAPIFSDYAGSTPQANPLTCSSTAGFLVYSPNGIVDETFSGTGIAVPFTLSAVAGVDPFSVFGCASASVLSVDNVQCFGATGDGAHNDTAAIQAAIAACAGRPVFFPAGTYLVSSLNILNSNDNTQTPGVNGGCSEYYGSGVGQSILKASTTSGIVLSAVSTGATKYPFYHIHDLTVQGPDGFTSCIGGGVPTGTGAGLRITGTAAPDVRLQNLLVTGFCGAGGFGIWVDKAEQMQWDKVRANYNETGIKLAGVSDVNASLFNQIEADQNIFGMTIQGLVGGTFTKLTIQSNYKTGLYMTETSGNTFSSAYFEHNNFSLTANEYQLKMDSAVAGNTYNTFNSPSFTSNTGGIFMSGDAAAAHIASGNSFLDVVPPAFQAGAQITLANSYATGNTWSGVIPAYFTTDPTATEIFLDATASFAPGARTAYFPNFVNRNYTLNIPGDHTTTLANISYSSAATPGTGRASLAYHSIGTPISTDQGIWDLGESSRGQTVTFYEDGGNNTHLWFNYRLASALTKGFGIILKSGHSIAALKPSAFAGLPDCGDANDAPLGSIAMVTDSVSNVWGDDIVGGGGNAVTAVCNRALHWTVMGK